MREIEVKAQVVDFDSVRAALEQRAIQLSDPVTQHDVVWGKPGVTGYNGDPWLRLRTESISGETRHIFTLKRSVTGQLDSIEHETEVADPSAIAAIALELGFVQYVAITKTRQKAYLGDTELCLDSVENLGDYIEAEKLTEETADFDEITDELWTLLEGLGVSRDDQVTDGYDTLMNKKLGKE